MLDVVYFYKKLRNDEDHFKFSIRSIVKNLKFNRIFIVGHKPDFVNGKVIYIPGPFQGAKNVNVKKKIKKVINDNRITENFYCIDDDVYLMKPYDTFPILHNKKISWWAKDRTRDNFITPGWVERINNLLEEFPYGLWYELHCPIIYNKQRLRHIRKELKLKKVLVLRSKYCNYFNVKSTQSDDHKIYSLDDIDKYKDKPWISSSNEVEDTSAFKSFIKKHFPRKSKFEK